RTHLILSSLIVLAILMLILGVYPKTAICVCTLPWSVDSDFAGPVNQIRNDGKNAVIFATSGKVSTELDDTGTFVFDVKKIKEFICWSRDLSQSIKDKINDL
ncbi:MAG: hypothetical protein UW01_C0013G0013, partial [Candidatus Nomurabacteria bacterium GW2011_GWA2_43_66]